MKKILLAITAMLLLVSSCGTKNEGNYYELVGGDKDIDWLEFVNDSTLRWIGPGPRLLESAYVEIDSIITVETAPLSRGFLYRQPDGSLYGCSPFFEGHWVPARKQHLSSKR